MHAHILDAEDEGTCTYVYVPPRLGLTLEPKEQQFISG